MTKGRGSGPVWALAKRELRGVAAERTLVLALFLQLFIALFSSFLAFGLVALYSPEELRGIQGPRVTVGLVGGDPGLEETLRAGRIRVISYTTAGEALRDFYSRRLAAVLTVAPPEPGKPPGSAPVELDLVLPKNDLQGTLALVRLRAPLESFEEQVRHARAPHLPDPYQLPEPARASPAMFELAYGLLLPLLVFLPGFISGALTIDLLTREWEEKTLDLLLVGPLTLRGVVMGKVIASSLLVPPQVALWLALLSLNNITTTSPHLLILLGTLSGVLLTSAAATFALAFKERSQVQVVYSLFLILAFLTSFSIAGGPVNAATRLALGRPAGELPLLLGALGGTLALLRLSGWQSKRGA
ncbi:MAG: ABC transporter permease subunit [Euryarchaeota archaeon]|nr:ABC transporter permease subunit [Euryarchaeota archaeon]